MPERSHPGFPEDGVPSRQGVASGKHEELAPGQELSSRTARQLSEDPLGSIPPHRAAEPLAHHNAHADPPMGGRTGNEVEQRGLEPAAGFLDGVDFRAAVQEDQRSGCATHADCQTVSRARPLALRRARTFRPFLVLIRLRNP